MEKKEKSVEKVSPKKKETTNQKKNTKSVQKKDIKLEKNHRLRFICLIAAVIAILIILLSILFFVKKSTKENPKEKDGKESTNVMDVVRNQALTYAKEVYSEDKIWVTEEQQEFHGYLSLADLETHYQKDISMFNTENIVCDTKNTYISFTANSSGVNYDVHLACGEKVEEENLPENEENTEPENIPSSDSLPEVPNVE